MHADVLLRIIPGVTGKDQGHLLSLVRNLEAIEDLFVGFIFGHGNDNRFVYVSPSIEKITGYPPATFENESGYEFFYAITPAEYRTHLIERAAFYMKQPKQDGFSLLEPQLMEMHGGLRHQNGAVSRIRYLGVVLEYTTDHDMLFSLCTWQKVDGFSSEKLILMKEKIEQCLIAFKEIYARVHPDRYHQNGISKNDPTRIVYPLYKGPLVTKKEYEVLQLISNGYSSKRIAEHLHISFHTAETHRKHLLGKFNASNTAELMKKASKVFWFE